MATLPDTPEPTLDIREQIARIDKLIVEAGKTRLDTRLAPMQIMVTALGAGAALFAAGAAFMKVISG